MMCHGKRRSCLRMRLGVGVSLLFCFSFPVGGVCFLERCSGGAHKDEVGRTVLAPLYAAGRFFFVSVWRARAFHFVSLVLSQCADSVLFRHILVNRTSDRMTTCICFAVQSSTLLSRSRPRHPMFCPSSDRHDFVHTGMSCFVLFVLFSNVFFCYPRLQFLPHPAVSALSSFFFFFFLSFCDYPPNPGRFP